MAEDDFIIGSFDPKTGQYTKELGGQGIFYKDTKAFREKLEKVCYIPELSDYPYTYSDFLNIGKGNVKLTEMLFEMVDWQSPETLFNDLVDSGEIDENGKFLIYQEGNE
jgi:hypothetical protein